MTTTKTINPYTGEVLNSYAHHSEQQIKEKLLALREGFNRWRQISVKQRVKTLRQACSYFQLNSDLIANEITAQMGKPIKQAHNEVSSFFERANYLLDNAEQMLAAEILPTQKGVARRIEHTPLGVVLILAAWNYPLLIAVNGVLTALLSGNTVMLKHAALTTSIGEHFERAFGNISGYENLVKHIITDHNTIANIIEHSAIEHVVFTGSVQGGKSIYKHTAKQFNQCHLELGGKDGVYVAADADPEKAAASLVDGAMYNAGQSCCAIERVYVDEQIYDEFIRKSAELIAHYKLGDPMATDSDLGPLASAKLVIAMQAQIKDAIIKGAKVLVGGSKQVINTATYFQATLLVDVNHQMLVMQEESFAPFMPVMKVSSVDQAIALINDCRYGLTSAIYTNDDALAEKFALAVDTGTVFRNRCDYLDPALPWTGFKDSGLGTGLSRYGFIGMTRRKAINFRITL